MPPQPPPLPPLLPRPKQPTAAAMACARAAAVKGNAVHMQMDGAMAVEMAAAMPTEADAAVTAAPICVPTHPGTSNARKAHQKCARKADPKAEEARAANAVEPNATAPSVPLKAVGVVAVNALHALPLAMTLLYTQKSKRAHPPRPSLKTWQPTVARPGNLGVTAAGNVASAAADAIVAPLTKHQHLRKMVWQYSFRRQKKCQ